MNSSSQSNVFGMKRGSYFEYSESSDKRTRGSEDTNLSTFNGNQFHYIGGMVDREASSPIISSTSEEDEDNESTTPAFHSNIFQNNSSNHTRRPQAEWKPNIDFSQYRSNPHSEGGLLHGPSQSTYPHSFQFSNERNVFRQNDDLPTSQRTNGGGFNTIPSQQPSDMSPMNNLVHPLPGSAPLKRNRCSWDEDDDDFEFQEKRAHSMETENTVRLPESPSRDVSFPSPLPEESNLNVDYNVSNNSLKQLHLARLNRRIAQFAPTLPP